MHFHWYLHWLPIETGITLKVTVLTQGWQLPSLSLLSVSMTGMDLLILWIKTFTASPSFQGSSHTDLQQPALTWAPRTLETVFGTCSSHICIPIHEWSLACTLASSDTSRRRWSTNQWSVVRLGLIVLKTVLDIDGQSSELLALIEWLIKNCLSLSCTYILLVKTKLVFPILLHVLTVIMCFSHCFLSSYCYYLCF